MDKDNTARLLRIVLLFGSALLTVGIVAYVDSLELTKELFWKLVFIVIVLPMIVPVVIFAVRYALLYQVSPPAPRERGEASIGINSKSIKQLTIGEGISTTLDNRSTTLDNRSTTLDNRSTTLDNRSTTLDNRRVEDNRSVNVSPQPPRAGEEEIKPFTVEKIVTDFFLQTGRYGFLMNDSVVIDAIRLSVLEKTGQSISKIRLLECLTSSDNYSTIGNEIVNRKEYEANKRDLKALQAKYLKETAKEPWNRQTFGNDEVYEA